MSLKHADFTLRMLVDTQRNRFVFEVVDLVQVAQHDVADDVQVTGATLHAVFLDGELAFLAFCLVQVKLWLHLEDVVTELDADWLEL